MREAIEKLIERFKGIELTWGEYQLLVRELRARVR